jgi:hypothetical protein
MCVSNTDKPTIGPRLYASRQGIVAAQILSWQLTIGLLIVSTNMSRPVGLWGLFIDVAGKPFVTQQRSKQIGHFGTLATSANSIVRSSGSVTS